MKNWCFLLFALMILSLGMGLISCKESLSISNTQEPENNNNDLLEKYDSKDLFFTEMRENNKIVGFEVSGLKDLTLTEVTIPEKYHNLPVMSIEEGAFSECSGLTSISLPNSVTNIGKRAFFGCSSLTNIVLPEGVTNIEKYTFNGCSSLISITIPNKVISIGYSAFVGCSSLRSIILPKSVVSIETDAFRNCVKLDKVYYTGTKEDWELLKIGDYNYALKKGTIYYYSENEPSDSKYYWHYANGTVAEW